MERADRPVSPPHPGENARFVRSEGLENSGWSCVDPPILACSETRAYFLSLLDQRPVPQLREIRSAHAVLRDDQFTLLGRTPYILQRVSFFLFRVRSNVWIAVHRLSFLWDARFQLFRLEKWSAPGLASTGRQSGRECHVPRF